MASATLRAMAIPRREDPVEYPKHHFDFRVDVLLHRQGERLRAESAEDVLGDVERPADGAAEGGEGVENGLKGIFL